MNPAARKEIKQVLPAFAVLLAVIVVPRILFAKHPEVGAGFGTGLVVLCASIFAASTFGVEFGSRTMPLLLIQPASRKEIWWLKMRILGFGLAITWLLYRTIGLHARPVIQPGEIGMPAYDLNAVFVCLVAAFCSLPFLTLKLKNPAISVVAAFLIPLLMVWGLAALGAGCEKCFPDLARRILPPIENNPGRALALLAMVYCGVCFWRGYTAFMRMEAIETQASDFVLPEKLERLTTLLTKPFVPSYRWAVTSLVRKELHLQRACFWISGICTLILLASIGVVSLAGPLSETGMVVASTFATLGLMLPIIVIPILASTAAIAEERNWGSLNWQLVLPARIRTQWMVKFAVAAATSLALAIILPTFMHAFGLRFFGPVYWPKEFFFYGPQGYVWPTRESFLVGMVVFLLPIHLGLFASSMCASTLRAALVFAGMTMAGAAITACLIWGVEPLPAYNFIMWSPFIEAGAVFLVLLHYLTFLNFRSESTQRSRLIQTAIVLAVGCAAMFVSRRFWYH